MKNSYFSTMKFIFQNENFEYKNIFNDFLKEVQLYHTDQTYLFSNFENNCYAKNIFYKTFSEYILEVDEFNEDPNKIMYITSTENQSKTYFFKIFCNPIALINFYYNPEKDNISKISLNNHNFICDLIKKYLKDIHINYIDNICNSLTKFIKQKEWDDESWKYWCYLLFFDKNFSSFVVNVFIHEFLHAIFDHLNVELYGKYFLNNPQAAMIAADFSINQYIVWNNIPFDIRRNIITEDNYEFMLQLYKSYVCYLKNKNLIIIKENLKFENLKETIDKILHSKNITYSSLENIVESLENITQKNLRHDLQKNSFEFYYKIISEQNFENNSKNLFISFDSHDKWNKTFQSEDVEKKQNKLDNNNIEEIISQILEKIKEKMNKSQNDFSEKEDILKQIKDIPFIDKFIKSKILIQKWKYHLRNFIKTSCFENVIENISFTRENRRVENLYPGKEKTENYKFILAIDSSSSISKNEYFDFVSEIINISKQLEIKKMRCLFFNTKVVLDKMLSPINLIKFNYYKIGGGTSLLEVFNYLENQKNTVPLIVFTDGYFAYFDPTKYKFNHLIYLFNSGSEIPQAYEEMKRRKYNVIHKYS
ncbi:MAG: VWA-like domain-containing protein [Candidatus Dojkabacteria bacterium]|nr:VWA-like domain-containing protein [Candidatus Dojkabacteria bacterium]